MEPLAPNVAFVIVLVVIAFASAVKGALGFGLPLITVPIAANLIGARTAIVLVAVPVVLSNLLLVTRGGGKPADLRRFGGLLLSILIGTVAGAQLLGRLDARVISLIVGIGALLFAAIGLAGWTPAISMRTESYTGPAIGLLSGLMAGTTGISAPLVAAYLQSLRLEKREFVFWMTMAFLFVGLTQVVSYYQLGLYVPPLPFYALISCLPVPVGTRLGFWIQDRLRAQTFRSLVLLLVFLSGLNLIVRALR